MTPPPESRVPSLESRPLPIAVLASGRGSNLQALIEARAAGTLPIQIVLVASDKAEARALRMAEAHNIPTLALDPGGFAVRGDYDRALFARLTASGAELVVLAGFMRIIDGDVLTPWSGRIINIHPSLLPKYRGLNTHHRALRANDAEHGASVHLVSAELDGGPLVAQVRMPILDSDNPQSLAERLLPLEHRLLVSVVAAIADHSLRCNEDGLTYNGLPLLTPLHLNACGLGLHSGSTHQARRP